MTMINDYLASQPATNAVTALAHAMATRLRGDGTEPSAEERARASAIVDATLDIVGRPFCVLSLGSDSDRWRLAAAIRRAADEPILRDQDVTFASKVIEILTESPREKTVLDLTPGMVRPDNQIIAATYESDPAVSTASVNGHHELRAGTVDGV
jgi:hypothetical protein